MTEMHVTNYLIERIQQSLTTHGQEALGDTPIPIEGMSNHYIGASATPPSDEFKLIMSFPFDEATAYVFFRRLSS